jgi:hypothetical protein
MEGVHGGCESRGQAQVGESSSPVLSLVGSGQTGLVGRCSLRKGHPAYDHINAEESMKKRHGTQAGDPVKGARGQCTSLRL